MTQRLPPPEKAARRRLRGYLQIFGGKRLVGDDRARVVAGFIRRTVIEIDDRFPGSLASDDIIGIDLLLKSSTPRPELEDLALKLAELQQRLQASGIAAAPASVTVH